MAWLYLCGAIISEVVGTSFLKGSDGFSQLGPSLIVLIGWLAFDQKLDWAAVVGVAMIVAGVAVINTFSNLDA